MSSLLSPLVEWTFWYLYRWETQGTASEVCWPRCSKLKSILAWLTETKVQMVRAQEVARVKSKELSKELEEVEREHMDRIDKNWIIFQGRYTEAFIQDSYIV